MTKVSTRHLQMTLQLLTSDSVAKILKLPFYSQLRKNKKKSKINCITLFSILGKNKNNNRKIKTKLTNETK